MYEPRFYRDQSKTRLTKFLVCYKETDLLIFAPIKLPDLCFSTVRNLRMKLDFFIDENPDFLTSLLPLQVPEEAAKEIREMTQASTIVGVGPMAAVAGVFAEKVGLAVLENTDEVIVENGGDLFVKLSEDCKVGVFAGKNSPFKDRLAIKLKSESMPLGVCTSSGMMGPSLSKGKADVVTIMSKSTALADAAATAVANRIKTKSDVGSVLNWIKGIEGIKGVLIIKDDKIGVWGEFELIRR
ncbi:MAG: UPF0280 family protein [Halanaerobiales bacterium]